MFDFTDEQLRYSLADTVAWCTAQFPEDENSDALGMRRRRALVEQANQLFLEAQAMTNKGLFHRKMSETKQWQEAFTLLEEVRASLGPLEHKLRSSSEADLLFGHVKRGGPLGRSSCGSCEHKASIDRSDFA
jgi:hypothetical protein